MKETAPGTLLTREALYALVWAEPMLTVAARFEVSSSYMARVCTLLNVPRPARGYWAKLAVGKAPTIPLLPVAHPGDELVWSRDERIKVARPLPSPPSKTLRRRSKKKADGPAQHPLINGAKKLFEAGRLSRDGYLRPSKRLLVDLIVTKATLDKSLAFANQLFSKLEDWGHRVVLSPKTENFYRAAVDVHEVPRKKRGYEHDDLWCPYRRTVVYVGTVAIGLTIIEMSEEVEVRYVDGKYVREKNYVLPRRRSYALDHSWTTKKDFPTGRLRLQAYSPYPRADWCKCWQETMSRDLCSQIKTIVKELEASAVELARLVEEGERQAELEHRKWEAEQEKLRQEEAKCRKAQALKDSRKDLLEIIAGWAEANRIEQFFQDAERRAADLEGDDKVKMLERLKLARELVGSIDAFGFFLTWRSPEER